MADPRTPTPRPREPGAPESPPAAWHRPDATAGRRSRDRSTSGAKSEPCVRGLSDRRSRGRSAKSVKGNAAAADSRRRA
eukprot:11632421-Alexandrium_andersonii.AAC.1